MPDNDTPAVAFCCPFLRDSLAAPGADVLGPWPAGAVRQPFTQAVRTEYEHRGWGDCLRTGERVFRASARQWSASKDFRSRRGGIRGL